MNPRPLSALLTAAAHGNQHQVPSSCKPPTPPTKDSVMTAHLSR